jgi:hypothetical protein
MPSAAYAGLELRSVLVNEWTCEPELQTRVGPNGSVTSGLFPVCKLRPVWREREIYVPDIPQNNQDIPVNPLLRFPSPSTSQPANPNLPSTLRIPVSPASPKR